MAKPVKNRLELEHRLRDMGHEPNLYQNDGQREAAAWSLKKLRQGKEDVTIDPRELGVPCGGH